MAPTSAAISAAKNPQSPLAIVFPIFAALACILYIPALMLHIKGRNFAASVLMISFMIPNTFNFINPLIWPEESTQDWWNGNILCDIEVKLQLGFAAANVGAVACIFRQLAIILDTDRTTLASSLAQRIRKRIFEVVFCIGVPTYLMIASYFVQTIRYYILSVEGCRPGLDNSWVSIVLVFMWPLILCVVATIYGSLATYRLIKYRQQFADILAASMSTMTKSRFIRLFALSTSLIIIYLPLSIFTFQQNVSFPRHSYSWKQVHPTNWSDFITMVPGANNGGFDRWIQIGTAFLVFPFFGLGQDAKALYQSWLLKIQTNSFTKRRTKSLGQTPLIVQQDASISRVNGQHRSDTQHVPVINTSVILHEHEPNGEICSPKALPDMSHFSFKQQGLMRKSEHRATKTCQAIRSTLRPRQPPTFKIWSDEEASFSVAGADFWKVKNQFELTEHAVNQQM